MDCQIAQIAILDFSIRLNQLNSSTHGKGEIILDESKTSSRLNIKQLWIQRIENGISAFLALNALAEELEIDLRCTRRIFLESLTTSL